MSEQLAAIGRLREFCVQTHPPGSPAAWLADRLRSYLNAAPEGVTLDTALGLKPGRGQRSWWQQEQRVREREAARRLLGELPDPRAAHRRLTRYAAGRGRTASVDARYSDAAAQAVHEYLRAAGGVPASPRTLERAAGKP